MLIADFLQKVVESYQRVAMQPSTARPPLSPTIRKAAEDLQKDKDLFGMLAAEKRYGASVSTIRGGRAITPLYNSAANYIPPIVQATVIPATAANNCGGGDDEPQMVDTKSNSLFAFSKILGTVGDKKIVYKAFQYPYIMIEEITHNFAPVHKEYTPLSEEVEYNTFPFLNLQSQPYHCPWSTRSVRDQPILAIKPAPVLVPMSNRNRVEKTIRSLEKHWHSQSATAASRPKPQVSGLGHAPLPQLTGVVAKRTDEKEKERTKAGFCECCYEKYSCIAKHVALESHRKLVCSSEFYRTVDKVIESLVRPPAHNEQTIITAAAVQAPLSPAKSTVGSSGSRIKSIPLKNITNLSAQPSLAPPNKSCVAHMDLLDVGSDSPICSSPSLKRRRSQRLVGRATRFTGQFLL